MPIGPDPVEEVFTPEQKREITKLITEAMTAFEGGVKSLRYMVADHGSGKECPPASAA